MCSSLLSGVALAEKADRDKEINFSSDQPFEGNLLEKKRNVRGNVIITQGTISIHADRIDFKQNPDNSLFATAYGNPVSFREKKDDSDEYYEGYSQRLVYDGSKNVVEMFDRALLKQGNNELRGNYVSTTTPPANTASKAGPTSRAVTNGTGTRVRGVFQPRPDATPGAKGAPKSDEKGTAAPDAKGSQPAAKDGKDAAAPGTAKSAPPLELTPDPSLPAK